jgi:hypothetical protein
MFSFQKIPTSLLYRGGLSTLEQLKVANCCMIFSP